ncbi:MAG: D-alanyl-D-alanine carboxypeptidase/D-alanyl-D-alanine-endopeptidase [Bacteroidales bacterium]|nr:D-alanyl-D-alanine carboxypeptidase/D-alanyl-D-alanine-endopeptidase [Bacteroidales bacterium]
MIHFKINRLIFWVLLCLPVAVSAQTPLQHSLDRLLDDDFFQTATIGVSVYDLTADAPLYNRNERRLCRPASNMKLLTAAAGLNRLTAAYEYTTTLSYTGAIDETGCLLGDLYITGGLDPEFSAAGLDSMVNMLDAIGIRRFEGNIYADISAAEKVHWGKGWSWDDDTEAFQPYLTALPFNKGVVKLKVTPASPSRNPAVHIEPNTEFIKLDNRATTVWKAKEPTNETLKFIRTGDDTGNMIEITGTIATKAKPYEREISVQSPTGYVLTVFSEKLNAKFAESRAIGKGEMVTPIQAVLVGKIRHSLPEVIRQMNKESDNLNAEMLLRAIALQVGQPATTQNGVEQVEQLITQLGFNPKTLSVVDGSGLSNQNYLTPEFLVAVLKLMYQSSDFSLFKSSLPEAGVDGTLKNRMKDTPAYRKVFAKTGTLTGISTLSGYIEAKNGHLLAFSIMVQNFTLKARVVNTNYIDKICEQIVESKF